MANVSRRGLFGLAVGAAALPVVGAAQESVPAKMHYHFTANSAGAPGPDEVLCYSGSRWETFSGYDALLLRKGAGDV